MPTVVDPNRQRVVDNRMNDFHVFIALLRDIALIAFAIVYIIHTV